MLPSAVVKGPWSGKRANFEAEIAISSKTFVGPRMVDVNDVV